MSFFNLSLRKVMLLEPDSFNRAKLKIAVTVLLISVVKLLLIVPFAVHAAQYLQVFRAIAIAATFLLLIKILLYRPSALITISHIVLLSGLAVIWTNLFIYAQRLNLVTIQIVFITTLTSYYLIGGYRAAIYSILSIFPVIFYLVTKGRIDWHLDVAPQELSSPIFETIVALNFLAFVLVHYLYYRAFHQNLKEKEVLNQQLQVNIAEAKALAHSRTLFLSTMSHELRTPLNGVIGMTNLLRDTALEVQKDNLDILEFSASNLLSLINDILDYNKSELDKIELEALPVNLYILMQKICAGLEIKGVEKSLILKREIDERLKDKLIITDPTRLTQIIYNLAGNAVKFTEQGTVTIKALIMEQEDEQIVIRFSVSDTGIGIPEDRQQAIFDPFIQASSDTTRRFGGTGLGLAIVKRLLMLFGSSVQLASQPGEGAVFTFAITFNRCKDEQPLRSLDRTAPSGLTGLKVLIVEDNKINILLLERLLIRWGIKTAVAVNGQEAVDKLLDEPFDLVLMDLHMPVMDGYDATLAIRTFSDPARARVPILALTASVSQNVYARIKQVGMQDYLPKPFHADQLHQKLQQLCAVQPGWLEGEQETYN